MTFPYIEAPALIPILALAAGCGWLAVRSFKGRYDGTD